MESAIELGNPSEPQAIVDGKDPFLLMITSGTTGFPKACSIDHETYALRCLNYSISKGMNHNERALMALPVHFNAGRGSVMAILYLGGTIIIQEKFDAERVLASHRAGANHLHHAGAGIMRALAALRALEQISHNFAPIPRHHRRPSFPRTRARSAPALVPGYLRSLRLHRLRPDHHRRRRGLGNPR